jgi:hypothetical protein
MIALERSLTAREERVVHPKCGVEISEEKAEAKKRDTNCGEITRGLSRWMRAYDQRRLVEHQVRAVRGR